MALLRRRQHPGRDRAQARHLAPGGAAPGFAGDQRAAHQGQARSSDRALHGARRGAQAALRPAGSAKSPRPIRPRPRRRSASRKPPRPNSNAGCAAPSPPSSASAPGRTMRAVADQLPAMECPQHKLVALVGTTKTDGSASFYDVIIRVSDSVRAPHYPMPLPVIARSVEERELLTSLASVKSLFDLVERTDVSFVGVGAVGDSAALVQDGIITRQEAEALRQLGAVGEITGWAFDSAGKVLTEGTNERRRLGAVAARRQPAGDRRRDGAVAAGAGARRARRAAHFRPGDRRGDRRASAAAVRTDEKMHKYQWLEQCEMQYLRTRRQIRIDSARSDMANIRPLDWQMPKWALPHRRKRYEGSREGAARRRCARRLLASRLRRHHADDRDRQQRRHGPHAGADRRFHQGQSRHQAQLGHARRERAASEGDDRHRHQGRPVRHSDHRHLRSSDLGQEEVARPARQARRRLRRRRPAARRSAPASRTTASSTPRRSTARAPSSCTART